MIVAGRRVSREALMGDPAFFGGGLLRLPNRPQLMTRNSVTSTAIVPVSRRAGILGRIGGVLRTAAGLGGLAIGGPVGAAISLGPALSRALPTPHGVGFPGFPGLMRGLAGVGPRLGGFGAMGLRRRKRMRVTNVRALRRALRRVEGFGKLARRFIRVSHRFKPVRTIRGRGTRGFRRRRRAA